MTQSHYIDREVVALVMDDLTHGPRAGCADGDGWEDIADRAVKVIEALFSRPPMEAVAWREKAQIVTEWLAMARETPKPLHSSLNYVPVSPSEFEALEAILQAMRGA